MPTMTRLAARYARAHRQLADDESDGDGRSAAPRRRRGDRLRRRRAGLRHARRRSTRPRTPAIDQHFTKYTPVAGTLELRRAICDRYRLDYGVEYTEAEVITSAGGKQALFNTALALFGAGRRSHHARAVLADADRAGQAGRRDAGARPHDSPDDGFAIRARADSGRAHAADARHHHQLAVQSDRRADLRRRADAILAQEAARREIWLIVDLCYEKLIYDAVPHNLPARARPHCRDLSVICGSASKAYAMTGWRCGWAIGPAAVDRGAERAAEPRDVERHLDHAEGGRRGADRIAGAGDGDARRVPDAPRPSARVAHRRIRACAAGSRPARSTCSSTSATCCRRTASRRRPISPQALLDEARVAVTPGEAFDAPGFVRISYATSMENLREGSRRLVEFVGAHAPRATWPDRARQSSRMSPCACIATVRVVESIR